MKSCGVAIVYLLLGALQYCHSARYCNTYKLVGQLVDHCFKKRTLLPTPPDVLSVLPGQDGGDVFDDPIETDIIHNVVDIMEWLQEAPGVLEVFDDDAQLGVETYGGGRVRRGLWKRCCKALCGISEMQELCDDLKRRR
ncbi:hypothetical protein CAPTEDRAFT_215217 [Capitella teleta]|uniref:Insulin-like domain-containing protein n=1 Tax=Capitella teleta TaxID=283909 RepID=R7VFP7_CAPTE|nr:hypothetical protein CAPTEDRAFT_215217 [Capitella teleta]|eukprot:ELU17444.1 hypothetical protein CAPTEDRAFT_215217 [Capitella teleta]